MPRLEKPGSSDVLSVAVMNPAGGDDEDGWASTREESAGLDAGRVFALSDGVFAIASTLLALDLRVPDGLDAAALVSALADLSPALRGYAISYLVIGLLWLGHHSVFRLFRRVTRSVAALNILLLGFVALLPFPSSVLTRYGDQPVAVMLYAADVGAVLVLQLAMLGVGWRHHDLDPRTPALEVFLPSAATAAVFAASLPIALLSPAAAMYFWLLLIPVHFVINRIVPGGHLPRRFGRA